ncbi:MAG TPA: glycosyltransferase family 2 protein, partial [Chloroflexota bacterium]|nr:glycosyltransferase family 2 protein [Chloroflexota bacterium]
MVACRKLSVVVPAYNEEKRLPASLRAIGEFLGQQAYESEIIVVDDGSEDQTAAVVEAYSATDERLRLIRNPHRGKAFAVRTGILASQGDVVFMCDADLSMPVAEIAKFLPLIEKGYG